MKRFIITLIFIIALCCFGYSAFSIGKYMMETKKTLDNIQKVADKIVEDDTIEVEESDEEKGLTPEEQATRDRAKMMKKYGDIYNENNDFMGWLKVKDTPIDGPVMFTPDDPQHYLRKNFYGEYDIAGMFFIDFRCKLDPLEHVSTDTIIYGHRMKNDTMFGPLKEYKDPEYCETHRDVTFDTMYRPGKYKIFASFLSEASDAHPDVFKYYDFIEAENEQELRDYLDNIKELSIYYDEAEEPEFGDEILTLSTCDYYKTDGRLAVLAKRVKKKEKK